MTGPIFVEGAEPGDTLEVHILSFEFLHPFGVTGFLPGGGINPGRLSLRRPEADPHQRKSRHRGSFAPGITLKLAPFFSVSIGVAPPLLAGPYLQQPSRPARRKHRQQGSRCRFDSLLTCSGSRSAAIDR